MQRQGMAQGAKAQVFGTRSQVGEYGQGVRVYRELFIKRVFQRGKDMETGLVRVQPEGNDIFDQRRMIMSGRALEFDVGAKTYGFGHNGFLLLVIRHEKRLYYTDKNKSFGGGYECSRDRSAPLGQNLSLAG